MFAALKEVLQLPGTVQDIRAEITSWLRKNKDFKVVCVSPLLFCSLPFPIPIPFFPFQFPFLPLSFPCITVIINIIILQDKLALKDMEGGEWAWSAFVNKMSKDGEYGTVICLLAACELYETRITIVHSGPRKDFFETYSTSPKHVCSCYHNTCLVVYFEVLLIRIFLLSSLMKCS